VLDDRDAGALEFLDERPRRVEVNQIVVRKLLALKLLGAGEPRHGPPGRNVQCCGLVRIFAVAHRLAPFERDVNSLRQPAKRAQSRGVVRKPLEFRGDFAVVPCCSCVSLARQHQPRRQGSIRRFSRISASTTA
jgi:hypothetical protein